MKFKATAEPLTIPEKIIVNPTVQVLESEWMNLPAFLAEHDVTVTVGQELILVWQRMDGVIRYKTATEQDLLTLKLVEDQTDLDQAAKDHGITIGVLYSM